MDKRTVGIRLSETADRAIRRRWRKRGDFSRIVLDALRGFDARSITNDDRIRARTSPTTILVTPEMWARLQKQAILTGHSMAAIIDTALVRDMQRAKT